MNTILTDDEIDALELCSATKADVQEIVAAVLAKLAQRNSRPVVEVIHARVEKMTPDQLAAYESARERFKLAQQEPVAWRISCPVEPDLGTWLSEEAGGPACLSEPLYTHPAPQQADRQRVPEWQPIETAPKDATAILVMRDIWPVTESGRAEECNGHNTYVAQWWGGEKNGAGAWICYMDAVCDPECPIEPTHWMPLPAPPAARESLAQKGGAA